MTNQKADIEHFFKFFEERVRFVAESCLERIEGTILMCSYLDSLAKYRYGGESTGKRFRAFILEFGNSSGSWQKISLWQLQRDIESGKVQFPDSVTFSSLLNRKCGSYSNFHQLGFNPDMEVSALEKESAEYMPVPWDEKLKERVARYEYVAILWQYRNLAVHETVFHHEAVLQGMGDETIPYYRTISLSPKEPGGSRTREVWFRIPPYFVLKTLRESIEKFKTYAEMNGIDLE